MSEERPAWALRAERRQSKTPGAWFAEVERLEADNERLRAALQLVRHKIEQTLGGQYLQGQALKAALYAIEDALARGEEVSSG